MHEAGNTLTGVQNTNFSDSVMPCAKMSQVQGTGLSEVET